MEDSDINPALMCSLESLQVTLLEDLFLLQKFSQMKHTPGSSLKIPLYHGRFVTTLDGEVGDVFIMILGQVLGRLLLSV